MGEKPDEPTAVAQGGPHNGSFPALGAREAITLVLTLSAYFSGAGKQSGERPLAKNL